MKYKYLILAVLVIILDQISKLLARLYIQPVSNIPVLRPIFYLTYVENTGAGFNLFNNMNTPLIYISLIIIGLLLYFFYDFNRAERISVSLIIGGATGNLIDRIVLGHVIDFLNFRIWPIFNLADSAISIGVIGLIYLSFNKNIKNKFKQLFSG